MTGSPEAMMPVPVKVLIFGLGNPLYGDDGLGSTVVEMLSGKYRLPDAVKLIDSGDLTDLLDFAGDYDHIIVIDVVLLGKAPGEITTFSLDEVSLPQNPFSHSTGFLEGLKKTENRPAIFFICAEPSSLSLGEGLSSIITDKIPIIINMIAERLKIYGLPIDYFCNG